MGYVQYGYVQYGYVQYHGNCMGPHHLIGNNFSYSQYLLAYSGLAILGVTYISEAEASHLLMGPRCISPPIICTTIMTQSDTYLCLRGEIPMMRPLRIEHEGQGILLCKERGKVYAFDEICPHKEQSMAHGVVFQGTLVCPWHQYKFDLESGACKRRRCPPATTIAVKIVGREVHLDT